MGWDGGDGSIQFYTCLLCGLFPWLKLFVVVCSGKEGLFLFDDDGWDGLSTYKERSFSAVLEMAMMYIW